MSSVYVSRLPNYVRDWELKNFFAKFGPVVSVRVLPSRAGARSGFVNFGDASSAQKAVANQYPVFLGRRIAVSLNTGDLKTENPYSYHGSSSTKPVPSQPAVSLGSVRTCNPPIKTEPHSNPIPSFTIKQEPTVLRPGESSYSVSSHSKVTSPQAAKDPFLHSAFSVSSPPAASKISKDPFCNIEFSVSQKPFGAPAKFGPIVKAVSGSPQKKEEEKHKDDKKVSAKERSLSLNDEVPKIRSQEATKRRFSDAQYEKPKKKVMCVGSLQMPRSAAEFVEANKKLYEEKSSVDDSPEDPVPPEIAEEKKRIVKVLNSGSSEKLQKLQLIGKKKADAIIACRRLRGKFRKVEDLAKITMFGDQFMQKFKEANFIS